MDLSTRQLQVDAAAKDKGAVAGDVAALQVLWDRAGHTATPIAGERVAAGLAALAKAAGGNDLDAAVAAVSGLRAALAAASR